MIEKLKLEPYILESLVAHLYEKGGTLVAERYDTVYWIKEKFSNVTATEGLNCYVDAKKFCSMMTLLKSISVQGKIVRLVLFNGAEYDIDMVEGNLPTFAFTSTIDYIPEIQKSVFEFGGVENAVSVSPLQRELNTVFVDELGVVASSSMIGGICDTKFKSSTPFAIPEGVHAMVEGNEAEWYVLDGKLFIRFSNYEIVSVLPSLPEFKWWELVRNAFTVLPDFVNVSGLKSSVSRLAMFGESVSISGGRILIDDVHWEPIGLVGSDEIFDIRNLAPVLVDDEVGVALSGGNLFMKIKDALFVCCSVVMSK